ncbi:MAG: hypothetical protein PVG78_03755 [Desulfobacterales bacterium]|jgi:hypothetical protein
MRLRPLVPLLAALAFFLAAQTAAAGQSRYSPLVQRHAGGWIDWQEGAIYGIGRGMPDMHGGSRPMARRAAKMIALQSILKIAAGIHIDGQKTLRELAAGSGTIEIEALIQFTEQRQLWVGNAPRPYYETVLRAPMTGIGGLTARLVQALRNRPMNRPPPAQTLPDESHPWLVLDVRQAARTRSVSPALFPRILAEGGRTLYDVDGVDTEALVARGMARYVTTSGSDGTVGFGGDRTGPRGAACRHPVSASAVMHAGRTGPGRTIVKEVVSIRGAGGTDLVVSENDAKSIAAEDALSRILRRCRVIILMPHPDVRIETGRGSPASEFVSLLAPIGLPLSTSAGGPAIGPGPPR